MTARYKAHNLLPDPKPTGLRGWQRFGNVEARMTADGTGIYIRNVSGGSECGIDRALPDLPAGDYVYAFTMSSNAYAKGEIVALIKTGPVSYSSTVKYAPPAGERVYVGEVTLTSSGCNWLFVPPRRVNGAMSIKRMLLVTREDWDHMSKHNVDYFDGDGYLTGGGEAPPLSLIHMLHWRWQHDKKTANQNPAQEPLLHAAIGLVLERDISARRRRTIHLHGEGRLEGLGGGDRRAITRGPLRLCTGGGARTRARCGCETGQLQHRQMDAHRRLLTDYLLGCRGSEHDSERHALQRDAVLVRTRHLCDAARRGVLHADRLEDHRPADDSRQDPHPLDCTTHERRIRRTNAAGAHPVTFASRWEVTA